MLKSRDLALALIGVRRLLHFGSDAFGIFDASPKGFWTSFWAAALVLPVWCLVIADQMSGMAHPSLVRFVAIQAIGYAISWLAYPLAMVKICDLLDRWPRYYGYMVAYNWFQVVQAVAWLPLVLLVDLKASPGLVAIAWLTTHGVLMTYSWFIARRGLQVDAIAASALVVIDLLLSLLIDRLSEILV
ncbi:hypothetical protein [Telmatospirillum sp.]|uniref:hypothetical protein n=1 Tax=Telmatospirillum sp. TaxID=2079197 RepID=UPI0028494845|nr:hypothetical protein [Telmatospirillum sp.]MDR3439195.1 hypothetical protein [Telmatospirillum sp.]